jgi:Nucleotidyl transferase AbiEii toxin, Type IV TA system
VSTSSAGLVQSVHARLVRYPHAQSVEPNLIFNRFAAERLLYRLSASPHAERFVLKGAFLLIVWLGEMVRPTRDVDLLGFGDLSAEALTAIFTGSAPSRSRRHREGPAVHPCRSWYSLFAFLSCFANNRPGCFHGRKQGRP